MSDKVFITKEGLTKLQAELKELVDVKRSEVAKKIQEAREMGDISENALYDTARQEQAFVEGRISELEDIVKNAQISTPTSKDKIGLGCKVTVHVDGDQEVFNIVGAPEANPLEKKISHESPLGASLMGKKVGEKVEVEAPMGKLVYKILKIE